ncbi:MAG: hypothetical protein KC800_05370 [Candidatus Eremiobacteraeota bacterium]|nr:hypothetical protein [Candidatus Eremiobacteraeota bacterium]
MRGAKSLSVFTVLFGLVTIKAGGSVLFVDSAREAAGAYVPFVLWFNFVAGFGYVLAGLGVWQERKWAAQLSVVIAVLTLLVFLVFGLHILAGGLYEPRTVAAMTLRSAVWLGIALSQRHLLVA